MPKSSSPESHSRAGAPDLPLGTRGTISQVDPNRARLALGVVQGLLDNDPKAEGMAPEAFDSLEEAAMSYAYLVGYLIEDVATARRMTVSMAIAELRARLAR